MRHIGGIMQNGIDDLDGNTINRGSGVVIVEGGSETMEHEVGRLDMTMIAVTADIEQMTDFRETLLNATVGGGLVLQSPHHVVLVSIQSSTQHLFVCLSIIYSHSCRFSSSSST